MLPSWRAFLSAEVLDVFGWVLACFEFGDSSVDVTPFAIISECFALKESNATFIFLMNLASSRFSFFVLVIISLYTSYVPSSVFSVFLGAGSLLSFYCPSFNAIFTFRSLIFCSLGTLAAPGLLLAVALDTLRWLTMPSSSSLSIVFFSSCIYYSASISTSPRDALLSLLWLSLPFLENFLILKCCCSWLRLSTEVVSSLPPIVLNCWDKAVFVALPP